MKVEKHLGEYIREKREALRIPQTAVAYKLGMSQPAYSKIERGETELKASQLYKIAAYLGVSVYDLLPESLASNVTGDYLLAPLVHYIRQWWTQQFIKPINNKEA